MSLKNIPLPENARVPQPGHEHKREPQGERARILFLCVADCRSRGSACIYVAVTLNPPKWFLEPTNDMVVRGCIQVSALRE